MRTEILKQIWKVLQLPKKNNRIRIKLLVFFCFVSFCFSLSTFNQNILLIVYEKVLCGRWLIFMVIINFPIFWYSNQSFCKAFPGCLGMLITAPELVRDKSRLGSCLWETTSSLGAEIDMPQMIRNTGEYTWTHGLDRCSYRFTKVLAVPSGGKEREADGGPSVEVWWACRLPLHGETHQSGPDGQRDETTLTLMWG